MKREYFPLNMFSGEVVKLFLKFDLYNVIFDSLKSFHIFAIKDLKVKLAIEDILLKDAVLENKKVSGKRLVSNKRKILFCEINLCENSNVQILFELRIYQKKAKGIILNKFFTLDSISSFPSDISHVLMFYTSIFIMEKELEKQRKKIGELKLSQKSFEDEIMTLDFQSIVALSHRRLLTCFEESQIRYTYLKLLFSYDEHSSKIDDGKQRKQAEEINSQIKHILDFCEKKFPKSLLKPKAPE